MSLNREAEEDRAEEAVVVVGVREVEAEVQLYMKGG
jgi:hypothetical protein